LQWQYRKNNPEKPVKRQFWRDEEIKRIRGLYSRIRRRLQEKKLLKKVKELGRRESRRLHNPFFDIL